MDEEVSSQVNKKFLRTNYRLMFDPNRCHPVLTYWKFTGLLQSMVIMKLMSVPMPVLPLENSGVGRNEMFLQYCLARSLFT